MKSPWDDELSPQEFEEMVRDVLAEEDEIANILELRDWFVRRYPTGKDRLAYARAKYRQWTRRPVD